MRVLVVTNMWPTADAPQFGVFVREQVDALRRDGICVDVMFINGRESRLNYLWAFGELRRRLRHGRYDVLHAHYVLSAVVALSQRRVPVVVTQHGIEVFQGWQSLLAGPVARRARHVVVVGRKLAERLGGANVSVIGNGVDLDIFHPVDRAKARGELGIDPAVHVVLFVGEPRPEKRLDLIHAAVAAVREERDGGVVLRTVTERGRAEVALEMNAADVLVLASDNEGDPVVVKEAMACNLPIVSTDVGTVRETIDDVDGCVVVEQSVSGLAEGIVAALAFGGRTDGRSRIESCSWGAVATDLATVYARVGPPEPSLQA